MGPVRLHNGHRVGRRGGVSIAKAVPHPDAAATGARVQASRIKGEISVRLRKIKFAGTHRQIDELIQNS